jgi:hypothetical protein
MFSLIRLMLLGVLVRAVQSSLPSPAHAEGGSQPRLALVADYSDDSVLGVVGSGTVQYVETPAPPVQRECTPRYMAGPAVGLVVGPGAMVGGLFMTAAGSYRSGLGERTARDRGLMAGGALVMAAGLGTFLYSIGKLAKNRHERRRICKP